MRTAPRKWLHPQAVPRGFLRLYILTLLSRGPETGYSIMQKIDERTEGAWRPGPGTMYPLLKGLVTDGLAKAAAQGRSTSKTYLITPRGEKELEALREHMRGVGRKERVVARLFSDMVPAAVFVPAMVNRYKEGVELFRAKISEIPQPDRDVYLKEVRLSLEGQLDWIDRSLEGAPAPRGRSARRATR